jgi:plastocyanin
MAYPFARARRRSFIAGSIALGAMLVVGAGVALAATRSVEIADFAFSPASITINVGDRVTWTNSDAVDHTATASNGSFDTGNIGQGESASVRFTQAGTYRYICTPHPSMTGTIRVRAASGGGGPTTPPTDVHVPGVTSADEGYGPMPAILVVSGLLLLAFVVPRRRARE